MSFAIYILGSLAAIAALALLIDRLRLGRPVSFTDDAVPGDIFLADYPTAEIVDTGIALDRRKALLQLADGGIGYVREVGSHWQTAMISTVRRINCDGPRLKVDLADSAAPLVTFSFATPDEAAHWARLLKQRQIS